ncbi:MAG: M14 family metallopeptidase [Chloroflexi bacterium]|nr:M14 family metallopeptidase [Chloroflexota bacterium]MDA1146101.1 M14 family metallopeptidase [Chloroflexota bacterium]
MIEHSNVPTGLESDAFIVNGKTVAPGTEREIDLPVARLPSGTWMSLPVIVMHGSRPGPGVWISAANHGDELNGIEIIRRVRRLLSPSEIAGTVIAVPVVNVFGFVNQSRYLPDRRDLNRSFPGSSRGSLAARLAHLFMTEIVRDCVAGIDLHTGSDNRKNLPQIRGDLSDMETRRLASAFGAPVMIDSRVRDGSLRGAATRLGRPVLLYEAGEAMRFDDHAIEVGVAGVMRTLQALGLLTSAPAAETPSVEAKRSSWVRARRAGIARVQVELGQQVRRGQRVAVISDPYGEAESLVSAPFDGLVIGVIQNPIVSQGDAIAHIARVEAV